MKVGDTVQVTPHFHHLCLELQKAVALVRDAENLTEENEAWPRLAGAREALYRYVEGLEAEQTYKAVLNRRTSADRIIVLRF